MRSRKKRIMDDIIVFGLIVGKGICYLLIWGKIMGRESVVGEIRIFFF